MLFYLSSNLLVIVSYAGIGLEAKTVDRRGYNEERVFKSKQINCPEICQHYNQYKDAVDQFDKQCLRGNFSIEKSQVSRKWWMKLYWGLFDSAVVNCWIIWKMGFGDANKFDFMTSMQDGMLAFKHPSERGDPMETRAQRLNVVPSINRGHGFHAPINLSSRLVCVLCRAFSQSDRAQAAKEGGSTKYKKPSRTGFKCDTCNVPLCVRNFLGEKNCFIQYHKDKNISGIDYDVIKRITKKK